MNNEPYGWHCFIGKGKEEQDFLFINGKGASKPDASWDKVIPLYTHPVNELTDEEWNKAFDFYCETDEGVLRFDLELRDEWKKEQLIRWKEALRKAQEKWATKMP